MSKDLETAYKEALNIVNQAFDREKQAVESVRFFAGGDAGMDALAASKAAGLEAVRPACLREIDEAYRLRCVSANLKPQKPAPDDEELRASRLVPARARRDEGLCHGLRVFPEAPARWSKPRR